MCGLCMCVHVCAVCEWNLRCVLKCYRAFSTFAGKYSTGETRREQRSSARATPPPPPPHARPDCLPVRLPARFQWWFGPGQVNCYPSLSHYRICNWTNIQLAAVIVLLLSFRGGVAVYTALQNEEERETDTESNRQGMRELGVCYANGKAIKVNSIIIVKESFCTFY